ncbi:MAG: ABC transporter permease [Eubacteriaceae bacterium]
MVDFPETIHLEIGKYIDLFIKWLINNFGGFFDALTAGILGFLVSIQSFLLFIPWFVFLIIMFLIGWKIKGWKSGLVYSILIFLVGTLGLWEEMILTLAVVLTSVIISAIIGVPLGIVAAYYKRFDIIIKPLLDAMQTMPSFVYLIPAMMLFGLGMVPAVFATVIYATPPAIRLTSLAIKNVSKEMKEAANSFGASPWQVLIKVELPQAFPTIMTGINQTTMMAMSMVVISSMIGAKGLGLNVLTAINRIDIKMGFEAGISIVFLAIIIDRITQGIADKYKISN